jgi:hypothetical protein
VKSKKKSNLKISSLELVQILSPRKDDDEDGEIANSLSEEVSVSKSSRCFQKFIPIN